MKIIVEALDEAALLCTDIVSPVGPPKEILVQKALELRDSINEARERLVEIARYLERIQGNG